MNRPTHFEILADNPEEIGKFYHSVFNWEVASWGGGEQTYWLVTTGPEDSPGINGGIMDRQFKQAVINTIEVSSLEETIEKVELGGGKLVHGPNEVPGVGLHAYCADPQGGLFGVMQPLPPEN